MTNEEVDVLLWLTAVLIPLWVLFLILRDNINRYGIKSAIIAASKFIGIFLIPCFALIIAAKVIVYLMHLL